MQHDKEGSAQAGEGAFPLFAAKMKKAGLPEAIIDQFHWYYSELCSSATQGLIPEEDITPVQEGDIPMMRSLSPQDRSAGEQAMDQVVMVKLNGGLGTSMGMPFAKSLLKVKDDKTFLDVILLQAEQAQQAGEGSTPLLLMNSLNTHEDVSNYLQKRPGPQQLTPKLFQQHLFPKVLAETLEPASWPENPDLEWNPPGHGDIYAALFTSGLLDELLESGKRYAFVSNADNLGAVIDPSILGHMVRNRTAFLMEVAQRSPADRKGGHLAFHTDGHLLLREIAQCPEDDLDAFQDIERYSFFNTNSIWFDLQALKEAISADGLPRLPLIVNPKPLNPRDEQSPRVYQLETAMGAAISMFDSSAALQVSRDRFAPVKKTGDLLAVRSNCMAFTPNFQLRTNPARRLPAIDIELDEAFYKKVDQFESRFPGGPPDLLECASFKVHGDVLFEPNIVCKGDVLVENRTDSQQRIETAAVLSGRTAW